jgi:tetratricopeptide (TPR) repeat protein
MQTVGLTDITIDYSSPGVKGRTIWGDLVPYDKIWRAGANSATKITFSKDVTIEGVNVPKGSYSIFMIPTKLEWTIIINKDATASTDEYKKESDIVRIPAKPYSVFPREHLAYSISDFTNEMATVSMEWEQVKVSFKVMCATAKQAVENIDKTLSSTWQAYNSAARYYYDNKEYDKALGYVNQSIALSEQWFNVWVKAQIMYAKDAKSEAYTLAVKAKELGDKNPQGFFFKDQVEKAIADWKPAGGATKKKK